VCGIQPNAAIEWTEALGTQIIRLHESRSHDPELLTQQKWLRSHLARSAIPVQKPTRVFGSNHHATTPGLSLTFHNRAPGSKIRLDANAIIDGRSNPFLDHQADRDTSGHSSLA